MQLRFEKIGMMIILLSTSSIIYFPFDRVHLFCHEWLHIKKYDVPADPQGVGSTHVLDHLLIIMKNTILNVAPF